MRDGRTPKDKSSQFVRLRKSRLRVKIRTIVYFDVRSKREMLDECKR